MSQSCGLCCGFCRICCYTLYQCVCCKEEAPTPPVFEVICIGVTNAGKSTLLSVLTHENSDTVVPTMGFLMKDIRLPNITVKVKELGGGDNIRTYWHRYYNNAQGVIFVIDGSCNHDRLEDTRLELHQALKHPDLHTLPWLILCNKQDLDGTSTDAKVIEELHLREAMQTNPHIIVKSSSKIDVDGLFVSFECFGNHLKQYYSNEQQPIGRI
uniref:ADP-ribosylation factor-like protein 15 n=1 Tax=Phallusia mammillata TaxID=59560 RepID=A0A6F9D6Y7_9ASCI|nr:ADP-ribosylation factor-like protein 15 [Phallusia mammillata]